MPRSIFLGGTCGSNRWRETHVIPGLLAKGVPEHAIFNPVVAFWDEQAQKREDQAKRSAEYLLLFVIASPEPETETTAVSGYSLVEAVMSLYDDPDRTVVVFDTTSMLPQTEKSMLKAAHDLMARFPYAPIFLSYEPSIEWLVAHR